MTLLHVVFLHFSRLWEFFFPITACLRAGMQVLEWNGVLLMGKTYEEVQALAGQPCNEAEVCVRL